MVRVKICGITRLKDAQVALEAGADAIGFVFAESPRKISPARAKAITRSLGPWVTTVGVFVNASAEAMRQIARDCRLSAIQLHGDEPPAIAQKLEGLKIIKAFRIAEKSDLRGIMDFPADAALLDSRSAGQWGGTGKIFDWKMLRPRKWIRPLIISGGLNAENVKTVVKMLAPYGVDVSSGVERSPGQKDPQKVREFIRNAKTIS